MVSASYKCSAIVNGSSRILISNADYASVELYNGFNDGLLKLSSVCCVIFMIIGIPGNMITVVALAKYKKVHNATAVFIMNMSFTDLLLVCIGPPFIISTNTTKSWRHGRVLCELFPLIKYLLDSVSIFSVMAITINRYILIGHPKLYRKIFQKRNVVIILATIWLSPLLTLIPTYLGKWGCFNLDQSVGFCSIVPDQYNGSSKKFQFISVLGLPSVLIIIFYTRIFIIVRKSKKKVKTEIKPKPIRNAEAEESITHSSLNNECPGDIEKFKGVRTALNVINNPNLECHKGTTLGLPAGYTTESPRMRRTVLQRSMILLKSSLPTRKDKRLGTMIVAILISFCVCHLPTVITELIRGITPHPRLLIASQLLLNISYCINPVIYVVMSKEYQKAYKNLLKCLNMKKSLI